MSLTKAERQDYDAQVRAEHDDWKMPRDTEPTEWRLTLHATMGKQAGFGLSVHQCIECFALVIEDFMPDHTAWHEATALTGQERPDA